jgi:RHS repeat-associated protein
VVSQTAAADGLGNVSTNHYAFSGGYYNPGEREFRGFGQVTVTAPTGVKTTTYFHQSGGRDNTALGEYLDAGTESKKGIPFRTEVVGSDGGTNKITFNKVVEVLLNTNGWYFPFVSQTTEMDFEGLSNYRATAKQFGYDTNNGNLITTASLGEVTNIVITNQTFTDIGSDAVYTWITYATGLGNILDRPSDTKITSDSGGGMRLRETLQSYDACGRMTNSQSWLDTAGSFVSISSSVYDAYGNAIRSTDAAGITTTNIYDSTFEQFPLLTVTGSFTNSATYDVRSGVALTSTDAKGLVSSNVIDAFNRTVATYISTNAYGAASLWKSRIFYSSGGVSNGVSYNYIHKQVNDAVDLVNGYETYLFADGLGRSIETRSEAETGQFRVANTLYDRTGREYFQTLTYFSSGTNYTIPTGTNLGTLTEYDAVSRPFRVTGSVQAVLNSSGLLLSTNVTGGDAGSPVGASTTGHFDGGNPWAVVVTDPLGNVKKSYADAYGRMSTITEVTSNGNYNTQFKFDLLGNPTNLVDQAGNTIVMAYDSLGRKTSMVDPDLGTWSYVYDVSGRVTQQTDARGDTLKFYYADPLGRLTSKEIYNSASHLAGTITYTYDHSDDPAFTVYKGQLYKVADLQGYERSSYDVRGRVIKTGRFLNLNAAEYVTQSTYDDADRLQQLEYPGNAALIQYSYDTAGNVSQVASLAGTGTNEVFYTPLGFNALGQLTSSTNGNGVLTTNIYYPLSQRVENVRVVSKGTNIQNLSYTYDAVANLKSIGDGVHTGMGSAGMTNIGYDQLYRLTSLSSTAQGSKSYAYSPIGNVLTNQDYGSGAYLYGLKPHAVTNANGTTYGYDACGNMTTRGGQTLSYDEQNQLVTVQGTNVAVAFGYDDKGERLWRNGTNGYTIWIGGIYEINNGKVLCHVVVDGGLVATFESQCTALMSQVVGEKRWFEVSNRLDSIMAWPFQEGRGFWTVFAGTWLGIIALCLWSARKTQWTRPLLRRALRPSALWRQAVTVGMISLVLASSTREVNAATYSPVFYYYHDNHLGSTNILTDRGGDVVQHYEYAAYGQTTYTDNSSAFPVSNRYTGQIDDDETGLYYYGARYYDPALGRFIQPDSEIPDSSDPQSINPYTYAGNNPLRFTDPTGHDGESFTDDDWDRFNAQFESNSLFGPQNFDFGGQNFDLLDSLGYGSGNDAMDNLLGHQFSDNSNPFAQSAAYSDEAIASAAGSLGGGFSEGGGGNSVLSTVTNIASALALVPGLGVPAALVAGTGEALQGNYGTAALQFAGAALGVGGFAAEVLAGSVADAVTVTRFSQKIGSSAAADTAISSVGNPTATIGDISQYQRVKLSKGTRAEIWERSKAADGKVYDPSGVEIKPGEPWQAGHAPGHKLSDAQQRATEEGWNLDTWKKYQRDPDIYRPEKIRTNLSHQYESDW